MTAEAAGAPHVIHSLRHSCGAALKKAGVPSEQRADILGHGGRTVTEEIYAEETELEEKAAILARLPLATAHLQPAPIGLLPWVAMRGPAPFARPRRAKGARKENVGAGAGKIAR